MDSESTSTKINRTTINNIPISMQNRSLEHFCSRFGKVKSITCSKVDKTYAVIEYDVTRFLDHNFYNDFQSIPFLPARNLNECFQNGQFLSNVLNSYNSLVNNTDENRNVINSWNMKNENDAFDSGFNICTYCYCCADFLCERCQSPYCSEKCQRLDWLSHKKNCSLKSRGKN